MLQRTNGSTARTNGHAPKLAYRAPPHNLEAEQALLGAILINNEVHRRVADFVHAADFFDPFNASIYETASRLIEAGERADPITLKPFFENTELVDATTTATQYLGKLVAHATTIINASAYGRTIRDLSTRRRLILLAEDMEKAAYEAPVDFSPSQQIAEHQQRLTALDSGHSRLDATSVATFAGRPAPQREWHAKGLIPAKNVTLFGGDGGTGKSLLAAQLAVATVLGRPWLGADVKRGSVVYLGAEDDLDEMHRRFADIAREQDVNLERLETIHICCLAGMNAVLATVNDRGVIQPTDLWAEFCRLVISFKPSLVVYDTLADLFGGNENMRTQVQQFVSMPRGLALETGSTALLLAHPSLSGMASGSGMSGSTAWNNSVRSRLYLDRIRDNGVEVDPDARVLRTMKANYGPKGGEIRLRWHQGVFVESSPEESSNDHQAEIVFLELLVAYCSTGRNVSADPGPTYAPVLFATEARAKSIGKAALQRAMGRLLGANRIRVVEHGSPSRRWKHLEVVP